MEESAKRMYLAAASIMGTDKDYRLFAAGFVMGVQSTKEDPKIDASAIDPLDHMASMAAFISAFYEFKMRCSEDQELNKLRDQFNILAEKVFKKIVN